MISKKISVLAIGFDYQEINCIQDELNKEFSHFNFDFAISIRDSWYRLNISDYDVVLLDISNSDMDGIIAFQEINRYANELTIIVAVNPVEFDSLSSTTNTNPCYLIIKDENFPVKIADLMKNGSNHSEDKISNELILNHKTYPLLQNLLNIVHDRMLIIGMDYQIKMVSQKILNLTQLSSEMVVGKKCFEFTYDFNEPCSNKGLPCPLQKISETNSSCNIIHIHKNPNKNCIHKFSIAAFPLKNEINSTDEILITIQKELVSQKSPYYNKKLLQTLIDSINDGLFFCDAEDDVVLLNKMAEKLFRKDQNQLLGRSILELPLGTEGVNWLGKMIETAKSSIHTSNKLKIQFDNKWFMLKYVPLYSEDNFYIGSFIYLADQTSAAIIEATQREIDHEIFTLTKYFPAKVLAVG